MVFRLVSENLRDSKLREGDALNGDFDRVEPFDMRQDSGVTIRAGALPCGRALDPTMMPTRMQMGGSKFVLPDFFLCIGYLASTSFRDVVERIEPHRHQFFPMDIYWSDGTLAASRYFFNVCNRIDSVNREHTTVPFGNIWKPRKGGEFAFDRERIGNRHAWIDMLMTTGSDIWISNMLGGALKEAELHGIVLQPYYEV